MLRMRQVSTTPGSPRPGIYQQLEKLEEDWGAVPFWPGVNEGDVPDLTTQTILERVPSEVRCAAADCLRNFEEEKSALRAIRP